MGDDGTEVEVLIPTRNRPGALAVTLATRIGQQSVNFNVIVSDQSDGPASFDSLEVMSVVRVLQMQNRAVALLRNLPRRGMAQQRQFLLDRSRRRTSCFWTMT